MTSWLLACPYCTYTITVAAAEWPGNEAWVKMLVHEKSCERA